MLSLLWVGSAVLIALLLVAAVQLRPDAKRVPDTDIVRIYCAASAVRPLEAVIDQFHRQGRGRVQISRIGGSGELAGQIRAELDGEVDTGADLYLTADESLLEQALGGSVVRQIPLAFQRPVIAVRADSDWTISDLPDLLDRKEIQWGIASPRAAVGQLARQAAAADGLLTELEACRIGDFENVMTLAQALAAGSLDAAIVWDSIVHQVNSEVDPPALRIAAPLDPQDALRSNLTMAVLADPTGTRTGNETVPDHETTTREDFCRFLVEADISKAAFERSGFQWNAPADLPSAGGRISPRSDRP